jgi:hypothetical protein
MIHAFFSNPDWALFLLPIVCVAGFTWSRLDRLSKATTKVEAGFRAICSESDDATSRT